MQELHAEVREWGRSMGIVIPKEAVLQERIRAGDTIKIVFLRKDSPLKELFGQIKLKRSTEKILQEIDEEGWNE